MANKYTLKHHLSAQVEICDLTLSGLFTNSIFLTSPFKAPNESTDIHHDITEMAKV